MRDASALALAVEHMETESGQKSPQTNDLLATLSPTDLDRLVQQAEYVELPNGQTLITPHTSFDHVYFPLTCMVSLVQPLADGAMIEVGVVGREGMVGIAALLGTTTVPSHAMAQIPGDALRIKVTTLREEIERNAKFRDLMYRYVLAMFVQIAQSAACDDAGHAPRRRHGECRHVPHRRPHQQYPWPHHDSRPEGFGSHLLRMLCRGEGRDPAPAIPLGIAPRGKRS